MDDLRFRTTVVRSRQFFSGYRKCKRGERHFCRDTQTAMHDFQQIFNYDSILVVRLVLWFGLGLVWCWSQGKFVVRVGIMVMLALG